MRKLDNQAKRKILSFTLPFVAILCAFAVAAILLLCTGYNPVEAAQSIITGSFGSQRAIALTLVNSTPLLLTGVAVAIAFQASSFNIGAEGQFFAGALGAVLVEGFLHNGNVPSFVMIPAMLLGAFLLGGIYGAIPGYLKAKRGCSEAVTSVMLSSVMLLLIGYLCNGPIQEPSGIYSETAPITEAAKLPYIWPGTMLHAGYLVAILVAILAYFMLEKTTFGYKIKTVGQNGLAAEYAGINNKLMCISTLALSGAIAGLAGATEVMGVAWKLYTGISPGYGYNAIAVALLGKLNPITIIFSAMLFGALNTGCSQMARMIGVPSALSSLMQALVLLFVVAFSMLEGRIAQKLFPVQKKENKPVKPFAKAA